MTATSTDIARYKIELRQGLKDAFRYDHTINPIDQETLIGRFRTVINSINGFIVICNYTTGLYEYISDNIKSYLGYDVAGQSHEQLTMLILSCIEEGHRGFLMNTFMPVVVNYLNEHLGKVAGTDFRYACCIKMKHANGKYIWYLIDTVVIEADERGAPLRTLITCTDISLMKKDDIVYYNVQQKNSQGVYDIVIEGSDNSAAVPENLTTRELQIISLIGSGYTNQDIADKIFVSVNTVKTHRKNILKKTNCQGTAELTNFAFARGLL